MAAPGDRAKLMQRVQEVVNTDPAGGGWEKAWQQSLAIWDLGGVTPSVSHLLRSGAIPASARSVLVPGCGTGYDVVAFAEGGKRQATGLDISETALDRAREIAKEAPGSESVKFVNADFFTYSPEEPADVIFDYTFFCALHPSQRQAWAEKTVSNLAPHGVLFTLVFPISDHEGGPPYAVSKQAYEEVLAPMGFSCEELTTVSHPSREGKELLLKWTRPQPSRF